MKDRIKEVRKTHPNGKNQNEFADFLGISVSNLASYESGRRIPSSAALHLISEKCNVNETWLRTGEGEMHDPPSDEQEIARVVQTLHTSDERIKKDIIIGLSKAREESLVDILSHILRELKSHGIDLTFDD